jgi:hypothetical protein
MFNYNYFIKTVPIPYNLYRKTFHCTRVPEGNIKVPFYTAKYFLIGWDMFIAYRSKPTEEQEIYELRLRHKNWHDDFKIVGDFLESENKFCALLPKVLSPKKTDS